jgi:hypothetical protein
MKIYAVMPHYDYDGLWITEDQNDNPLLYATRELAEQAKSEYEAAALEIHEAQENRRYERWLKSQAAKIVLEKNSVDVKEIDWRVSDTFISYKFDPKVVILELEVNE